MLIRISELRDIPPCKRFTFFWQISLFFYKIISFPGPHEAITIFCLADVLYEFRILFKLFEW